MSDVKTELAAVEAQLEAKRKAREAREQDRQAADELAARKNELLLEELLEKFDGEGDRGVDYQICDVTALNAGYFVVRRGPSALVRAYKAKFRGDKTPSEADTHAFVKANLLHPTAEEFNRFADRHEFLALKLANVICEMHAVGVELKGGKR